MPYPQYTPEEVAQRGEAMYERQIRARVEPEHLAQFVVIDSETGDYELDVDDPCHETGAGQAAWQCPSLVLRAAIASPVWRGGTCCFCR